MADTDAIYRCNVCGNVVNVVEGHEGTLVCCEQDMEKLVPKTQEQEGKEKHVPVIEKEGNMVKVNVGSVDHPMEENHHIELIQLIKDGKVVGSARLYPDQKPEAAFCVEYSEDLKAVEYCNVHGLWTN